MSISFIPTAGTWTSYSYREADPQYDMPGDDKQHGIVRTEDLEPSLDCHNSGGLWLLDVMGLHQDSCGEATSGEVARCIQRVQLKQELLREQHFGQADTYEARKLSAALELLRHCQYHNCGFTWG